MTSGEDFKILKKKIFLVSTLVHSSALAPDRVVRFEKFGRHKIRRKILATGVEFYGNRNNISIFSPRKTSGGGLKAPPVVVQGLSQYLPFLY